MWAFPAFEQGDSTMRAIVNKFLDISYCNLAGDSIPEQIHVREVFAIGHTQTAKELTAVAQVPFSRIVRGLELLTENVFYLPSLQGYPAVSIM